MYAWQVLFQGEPEQVLALQSVPEPIPEPGQLRVRVTTAACNFSDVLLCRGEYQVRPSTPFTPGLEVCGAVDQVGTGVPSELLGRRVVGQPQLPYGGMAEFALMDASSTFEVPPDIDSVAAAALHLTYLTPWLGLNRQAVVQPSETLVVTGAAGGVGMAAVQLGLAAGAEVIGIVSDATKAASLRELGAHHVIDRSRSDVRQTVLDITGGRGTDVVFETAGGSSYDEATRYIAFEGRILIVGFASGTIPQPRLNHAMVKNYSIHGLHWSLYLKNKPSIVESAQASIFDLASTKWIHPLIDQQAPMAALPAMLKKLIAGTTRGKIIVTVAPSVA